jgi:hypothetical protein
MIGPGGGVVEAVGLLLVDDLVVVCWALPTEAMRRIVRARAMLIRRIKPPLTSRSTGGGIGLDQRTGILIAAKNIVNSILTPIMS